MISFYFSFEIKFFHQLIVDTNEIYENGKCVPMYYSAFRIGEYNEEKKIHK